MPAARRERPSGKPAALIAYRIDVGRNQGATPREIVGALANEGGFSGGDIGQIHLFSQYSTVELPARIAPALLEKLKRTRVKQTPINLRPMEEAVPARGEQRRPYGKR